MKTYKEMKTYKVWVTQKTNLYAYVEAENQEQAWDLARKKDGSDFIAIGDGDWEIYSVEEE